MRTIAARLRRRDLAVPSVLATLARAQGLAVDRAHVCIFAREAGSEEAHLLGVRTGTPVLVAEFSLQADGHPAQFVRATVSV